MKESEPSKATETWLQVVNDFRRVCFLKRDGKTAESQMILAVELPKSIAVWSSEETRDGIAQRQALQEMFISEERRVEDAWQMKSLLRDQLRTELLEDVREEVRKELQRERSLTPQAAAQRPTLEARPTLSLSTSDRAAGVEPPSRPWKPPTLLRRTPTFPSSHAHRPAPLDASASHSSTSLPLFENPATPSLDPTASLRGTPLLNADISKNITATATGLPEQIEPTQEATTFSAVTPRRGPSFDDLAAVLDFVLAGQSESESALGRQSAVAS